MSADKVEVYIVGKDELSAVLKKAEKALDKFTGQSEDATDQVEALGDETDRTAKATGNLSARTIAAGNIMADFASFAIRRAVEEMTKLGERAIEVASRTEQFETSLTVLTGSAEQAKRVLAELDQFSLSTPFTPAEVQAAGRDLIAYGFQVEEIQGLLRNAGDAAATFADKIRLEDVTRVFARIKAGDFGEAFERLRDIGLSRDLLEGEGLIFDKSGSYQGSVEKAMTAVQNIIQSKYGGMMEQQSKTFQGMKSTLEGYFESFLGKIMESGAFEEIKKEMQGVIEGIKKAIESGDFKKWAEDAGKAIKNVISFLQDIGSIAGDVIMWFNNIGMTISNVFSGENSKNALQWVNQMLEGLADIADYMAKSKTWGEHDVSALGQITKTLQTWVNVKKRLNEGEGAWGDLSVKMGFDPAVLLEDINKLKQAGFKAADILKVLKGDQSFLSIEGSEEAIAILEKYKNKKTDVLKAQNLFNDAKKKDIELEKQYKAEVNGYLTIAPKHIKTNKDQTAETDKNTKSVAQNTTAVDANQKAFDDLVKKYLGAYKSTDELTTELNAAKKALDDMRKAGNYSGSEIEDLKTKILELEIELSGINEDLPEMTMHFQDIVDTVGDGLAEPPGFFEWLWENVEGIGSDLQNWSDAIYNAADALGLMSDGLSSVLGGVSDIGGALQALEDGNIPQAISGAISGVVGVVSGIVDMLSGETFAESFARQMEGQGFDDTWSEELINKIEEAADLGGSKEAGIKAYLEEFFAETDINSQEELQRMSDLLNEVMGEMLAQGYTVEEVYAKYGDELEQLTDAMEQYGLESTAALEQMIEIQRTQTKEGRYGLFGDVLGGLENAISAMAEYGYSQESFSGLFATMQDVFEQMKREGYSMDEIWAAVQPAMENAMAAAQEAGIDTSAMSELQQYYERMAASSGLFDIISSLQTAVSGMADSGILSQDNLNSMAAAAQETYDKLMGQGFSETEILAQMGPLLSELAAAAEQFGYQLPAGLSDLADAAEEMGFGVEQTDAEILQEWSDEFMTEFSEMTTGMKDFFSGLSQFDTGGVVGGALGEKQLAFVHGGELVVPASQGVPVSFTPAQAAAAAPQAITIRFEPNTGDPILNQFMALIVPALEDYSENGRLKLSPNGIKDE